MISPEFWGSVGAHPDIYKILTDPSECWVYGSDNSKQHHLPEGVIFPKTEAAVQHIVQCCYAHQVPITCRGRGTGTPGGAVPLAGGIVLCFEWMNQILEYNPADRLMVVQPGVLNETVQKKAAPEGLLWGPDPSSQAYCTVGGNLAYNSAGPRAVYYGTTRENTLGLHVIDGCGRLLKTGFRTTKSVVGYDLTRLFIGSEGTLGIVSEATLQLKPAPSSIQTLQLCYDSTESAVDGVIAALLCSPLAVEFIDHAAIQLIQKHHPDFLLPQGSKAILLLEFASENHSLDALMQRLQGKTNNAHRLGFVWAKAPEERERLWKIRKMLSPTLRLVAPNKINEDVVVPVSKLAEFILYTESLSQHYQLPIVNFGHAGNGNLHVNILFNAEKTEESQKAHVCLSKIFEKVLFLGGTISGEHGIGSAKRPFVEQALSSEALEAMKSIKAIFDPKNILNPGKIWP